MMGTMLPNLRDPRVYVGLLALTLMFVIALVIQNAFWSNLFVMLFAFAAMASAWNIVGGFAGQLSLGHAVFYGVGGYAAMLLAQSFDVSPWIGMMVGMVLSGVLAAAISVPTLRLKGPFYALATIAVLEVMRLVAVYEARVTGGSSGVTAQIRIGWEWIVFREKRNYVIIAFAMLLIVLWCCWRIKHSRFGYHLAALREREDAALAVGVNISRSKLFASVISAVLTSMVGSFYITFVMFVDPDSAFSLNLSVELAMFALIGGMGTVAGPVLGTFLVLPISEFARASLSGAGGGVHGLVYGAVLIIAVLGFRKGIVGALAPRVGPIFDSLPRLGRVAPELGTDARAEVDDEEERLIPVPAPAGDPVLKADHLFKAFGGLQATQDVSFAACSGEVLGIIGPNGAGKTTLFNQLSGFIPPDDGNVTFLSRDGAWVELRRPNLYAGAGLSRTFQIAQPFGRLTVLENIMLGSFVCGRSVERARHAAGKVARMLELWPQREARASTLTVARMKRLEIARAVATGPRVLLLDEVMAGLNPTDVDATVSLLRRIAKSGVTIILIEHMMRAVTTLCDRVIVIDGGRVIAAGSPDDIVKDAAVIEAYLGRVTDHA